MGPPSAANTHTLTQPKRENAVAKQYRRSYRGPVAMLVSGKDRVVLEKFGRRLCDRYASPKRLWEFPQGNHGTVMEQPPPVWKQIIGFWQAGNKG